MKKFTKILSLILCLVMMLSLLASCASNKEEGNNNKNSDDGAIQTLEGDFYDENGLYYVAMADKTCKVSVGRATGLKKIVIPATYQGYTVTTIAQAGFANCEDLESITIPDTVETIESLAFQNCSKLLEIKLGNNAKLKKIGYGALKGTAYYEENGKDQDVFYFGKYLIEAKKDLTACEIKDGTTVIAAHAFYGCTTLKSVTIPASVKYIDTFAFNNCSSLKRVYISSMKAWCSIEFADHTVNPLSLISKGTTKETIDGKEVQLTNGMYLNGTVVTSVEITSDITSISDYAFYNYQVLESVYFSEAIKTIGNGAFGELSLNSSVKPIDGVQVQIYKVFYAGNQNSWKAVQKAGAGLPGNDHIDFAK